MANLSNKEKQEQCVSRMFDAEMRFYMKLEKWKLTSEQIFFIKSYISQTVDDAICLRCLQADISVDNTD